MRGKRVVVRGKRVVVRGQRVLVRGKRVVVRKGRVQMIQLIYKKEYLVYLVALYILQLLW